MRFDKALADSTIRRFNELQGVDGIEPGSLFRWSQSGRQTLSRVTRPGTRPFSSGGRSEVGYGIATNKDIVLAVNAMIDQWYHEHGAYSDPPLVSVELYPRFPELSTLSANTGRSVDALVKQAVNAMLSDSPGPLTQEVV